MFPGKGLTSLTKLFTFIQTSWFWFWFWFGPLALLQVYPWGAFEEDETGEQYFQNLPTSSAIASPAVVPASNAGAAHLGRPATCLAPPSPPSPSPSPHLSNTDGMGEETPSQRGWTHVEMDLFFYSKGYGSVVCFRERQLEH